MGITQTVRGDLQKILASERVRMEYETIRAVGGFTRFLIISVLNAYPPGLTATDLTEIFQASPSKISHQIRILRNHHLIVGKRTGQTTTFQLNQGIAKKFL